MIKIAIIHGTKGSPTGNWFQWLRVGLTNQLRKQAAEVIVPTLPTPVGQSLQSWLEAFQKQVGSVDSSTIVIGHSVGAVFLLRLLERLPSPILSSVFVAGLTGTIGIPEYDALNSSFIAGPYDWETIRKNAGHVICLSGDNDPYVPLVQGLELAEKLHVEACVLPGGGHLNAESGYTDFPLLLEMVIESARHA